MWQKNIRKIYLRQHGKHENRHQRNAQHDQILWAEGQGRTKVKKTNINYSDKRSLKGYDPKQYRIVLKSTQETNYGPESKVLITTRMGDGIRLSSLKI